MFGLMTVAEHRSVYQVFSESVIAEPPLVETPGLDPRVLKGCELLDREHPGWADKIKLELFDLKDGTNCVIGQVFGDYDRVEKVLGLTMEEAEVEEAHGFCVYGSLHRDNHIEEERHWKMLEKDWITAIRERQLGVV